jgi:hypothetical protein
MTKSDLKTGMIVENACGEKLMVFRDIQTEHLSCDCFVQIDQEDRFERFASWDEFDNYDEELNNVSCPSLSIVKVFLPQQPAAFFQNPNSMPMKLLWERQ